MADNYLEKKMEEHRRGGSGAALKRRSTPVGERPGTVSFKLDPLRVLVTDCADDFAAAVITRLCEAGCKVAFSSSDDKSGRLLAQKSGARYYPPSFTGSVAADLEKVWGGVDAVVMTDGQMPEDIAPQRLKRIVAVGCPRPIVEPHDGLTVNEIVTDGFSASEVAHIVLLLCLDASNCIDGMKFSKRNL